MEKSQERTSSHFFGQSDPGCVREHNEDAFFIDSKSKIGIVCDGVGGNAAGEVASKLAVDTFVAHLKTAPENTRLPLDLLEKAVSLSSEKVFLEAEKNESYHGMATTLVALWIRNQTAYLAHVGDSRAYLIRDGKIHQLTEDHTFVQEMLKAGKLTKDVAEKSPFANVITRAVGKAKAVLVDTLELELASGDRFILCSDGITDEMSDQEILEYSSKTDAKNLSTQLIGLAKNRGAKDNVTVVCIDACVPETFSDEITEKRINPVHKIDLVGANTLFKYLTYPEKAKVTALAKTVEFKKDQVLFQEGDPGTELYLVLQGEVQIKKGQNLLKTGGVGEILGEMSIVDESPRSATLQCSKDSTLLVWKKDDLFLLMKNEPSLAVKIMWAIAGELNKKLRNTSKQLSDLQSKIHELQLPFRNL